MKKNKKIIFTSLILIFFITWLIFNLYFYINWINLKEYLSNLNLTIFNKIIIISFIYIFRNYLLIPSTIIILLTSYFLENFMLTLIISTIWVWVWIFQTYFVWYILSEDLEKNKNIKLIEKYKIKIKENWFKVIFTWAFFPIIPVDIIYYTAWILKYNVFKTFLAWLFWELPLIILYSYLWEKAKIYEKYFIFTFLFIMFIFFINFLVKKYKK